MLPLRRLGSTDLLVSPIGLGTVKFGRNQCVKYPEAFSLPDDASLKHLLHEARDLGINLVDTAPAYGTSEERLGKLLKGQRQDWVISTKAGEAFTPQFGVDGLSQFDFSPAAIKLSVETSLRRLHTDYLDVVLIHSNGDDEKIIEQDGALETLATLKQAGWIRAFGMSTKTHTGLKSCLKRADLVMTTFDPQNTDDLSCVTASGAAGMGLLIKKVFNSGHLLQNQPESTKIAIIEQTFAGIFDQPAVGSAIIGTLNPLHLRLNIDCARNLLG